MLITKLSLKNWGPHKDLTLDLNCNVAGVIGPNGHGKSNLLQAIDFGLNKNLNKQNKEEYIHNYGLPDGAKSAVVDLWFRKNGKDGHITRTITKSGVKNVLEWDGATYTADAKVSEVMTSVLGADKAAMANAIFVKQGDLARLVKGTPAVRQDIFQKLMNLNFLDIRDGELLGRITKLKAGLLDLQPTLDALNEQRREIEEWVESTKKTLEDIPYPGEDLEPLEVLATLNETKSNLHSWWTKARGDSITLRESLNTLVRDNGYESLEGLQKALEGVIGSYYTAKDENTRLEALEASYGALQDTEREIESLTSELSASLAILSSSTPLSELRSQRDALEEARQTVEGREAIMLRLEEQEVRVLAARESYQKIADQIGEHMSTKTEALTAAREYTTRLREELTRLGLKLELFSHPGVNAAECPICGTPRTPLTEDEIEAMRAEERRYTEAVKDAEKVEAELQEWITGINRDAHTAITKIMQEQEQLDTLKASLAAMPATTDTRSAVELREAITQCDARLAELSTVETRVKHIQDNLMAAITRADKLREATAGYSQGTNHHKEVQARVQELEARRKELQPIVTQAEEISKQLQSRQNYQEELEAKLQDVEARIAASHAANARVWVDHNLNPEILTDVVAARDIVRDTCNARIAAHTDNLRAVASLQGINEKITEVKSRMEKDTARRELIEDLVRTRQLTSSNGIPLAYMNMVFRRMSGIVRDLLQKMQANFTVVPDDERPLTFKFIRTDEGTGYEMKQELLSGGQAIRLSLALLIACQQIILPDVGLLVLDEPSSHVDADGVESLREMFLSITSVFHSSETQLIVVDHHAALKSAFEKTISL